MMTSFKALFLGMLFTGLSFASVKGQDLRETVLKGNWVKEAGFRGYEFKTDTFNVMDYGAANDGVRYTTPQLQNTIDACFRAGGGVVYFPAGNYYTGSLFLKDNVHLVIDENAVLLASMSLGDYPQQHTRVAGIEMVWPMAIINIKDARNVEISGKGTINGRGKPFWDTFWNMKPVYEANDLRWALDYDCKRPRMLLLQNSENVKISGITFTESAFWTVHVLYSRQVTVDGITIRNNVDDAHGPSTDGIDIDSSDGVLVQNCDIECNDDNICLKAGRDADGLRVNRPCQHIVIRNNKTGAGAGLVTFGSETSGGINHVYVHDMTANGTTRGIRFKSARTRGGLIEDILFENITIMNTPFVFEFTMDWNPKYSYTQLPGKYKYDSVPQRWKTLLERVTPPERGICTLRDVLINNVEVKGKCWKAFRVEGFEEAPIDNFVFRNVDLHTETAGSIKNARNWKAVDSKFVYDDGKPPEMINCKGMDTFYTQ